MKTKYKKLEDDTIPTAGQKTKQFLRAMFKCCAVALLTTLFVVLCSSLFVDGFKSGPIHASCKIDWTFSINCTTVSNTLVQQIKKWQGKDNCEDGGEKCFYELISVSNTTLVATHKTPVKGYVDDISFKFTSKEDGCAVLGYSTSRTWYAVLDYGTNYCNLHNLITGSGLDKQPGYTETTKDSICTQYLSADCEKY